MSDEKPKFVPYGGLPETIQEMGNSGVAKCKLGFGQIMVLGFMASIYLTFATTLAIVTSATIESQSIQMLVRGVVFPIGLIAIVIGGAELYTGNAMVPPVAAMMRRTSWTSVMHNWVGSYTGNFIGGIFGAFLIITATGILGHDGPFIEAVKKIAVKKTSLPFSEAFWRALACVWLVDLAVYLAGRTKEIGAKFFLIWFPTFTFFAIGFEHSIVNMFVIPAGILAGAPVTWGQFLLNNLTPVILGNTVAGLFCMGMLYWYSAGMPVEKPVLSRETGKGAEGAQVVIGDYSNLYRSIGIGVLCTIGFTVLLPGGAGILAYFLLEGAPEIKSVIPAAEGGFSIFGEPIIVIAYFVILSAVAARIWRRT
ncbi:MAG: formate/nitrite transporter family protein [Nitrospirae bacterium]|nr:formate/nitrite transporter family protein [Nitrospirota bacterium]